MYSLRNSICTDDESSSYSQLQMLINDISEPSIDALALCQYAAKASGAASPCESKVENDGIKCAPMIER